MLHRSKGGERVQIKEIEFLILTLNRNRFFEFKNCFFFRTCSHEILKRKICYAVLAKIIFLVQFMNPLQPFILQLQAIFFDSSSSYGNL